MERLDERVRFCIENDANTYLQIKKSLVTSALDKLEFKASSTGSTVMRGPNSGDDLNVRLSFHYDVIKDIQEAQMVAR